MQSSITLAAGLLLVLGATDGVAAQTVYRVMEPARACVSAEAMEVASQLEAAGDTAELQRYTETRCVTVEPDTYLLTVRKIRVGCGFWCRLLERPGRWVEVRAADGGPIDRRSTRLGELIREARGAGLSRGWVDRALLEEIDP